MLITCAIPKIHELIDKMSKRKAEESSPKAKRKAPDIGNKNEDLSNMLSQLSDYEKNVSNNIFKAKAYKKAAHAVCKLSIYNLKSLNYQSLDQPKTQ